MSVVAIADTHATLWYIYADPRLSAAARTFIHKAVADRQQIGVATISLVEIAYLIEKDRIRASAFEDIQQVLTDPDQVFVQKELTADIAASLRRVPREEIPDMPDRIVAATALHLGVPIISRDGRISSSTMQTIW